ncbi:MAG: hypothetical protein JXA03_08070 [Bacteroidales bacterium]|nr:hypothetical protein [Bacteroidales bacterium]
MYKYGKMTLKMFFLLLFSVAMTSGAQDTITMMHYNLLNYGNNYGSCNSTNNNVDEKTAWLKTVVDHVRPDIITVNEISKDPQVHQKLLDYALNIMGSEYLKASPPNYANSSIMNQVFYRTQKLELIDNTVIVTNVRDIDIFRFKYRNPGGLQPLYLNCAVAHLKAGDSPDDEQERADEALRLMNYLSDVNASGNFTLSGDFNVYSGYEQAYQKFINHSNPSVRFYDPLNKTGQWHENSFFSDVHTQSTHNSGSCHSGGGLDDRFDFILVSDEIMEGSEKISLIEGSYKALGQDGLHFNTSVNASPQNTSLPPAVLDAVYNLSDHLPVVCKMYVEKVQSIPHYGSENLNFSFTNPVQDELILRYRGDCSEKFHFSLFSRTGGLILTGEAVMARGESHAIPVMYLSKGLFLLKISAQDGKFGVVKFVKQ